MGSLFRGFPPKTPVGQMGKELSPLFKMTEKRNINLTIRVTPSERLAWQEKAALSGLTLSNLIRQAMSKTRTWTVSNSSLVQEQTRQIARIGNNLNQIAKWANTYKQTAEAIEVIQALRLIQETLNQLSTKPDKPSSTSEDSEDVT
ncbi:hypothetical protein CY0110_01015 [Crocosphaera chwakensis CCY0110]|uniref:Uncharacterized protein n=3 Tax=Crocosphaera TaxID=263510 RepID=A3IZP8_9CHRO|nr:hypothetical protein CY0110_01015 [Crocosphaera chwakensis CCY0110]